MENSISSAASSFAKRGTLHSKRIHNGICVGALIIAENGINLRADTARDSLLGISKKRRMASKLEVANDMRAEDCFERKKKESTNEDTLLNWRRDP